MEMRNKTLVAMALALVLVIIVPVAAYFWQTEPQQIPTGIILQTPGAEMGLGIYWDSGCTEPVTTIDFGEMWHPNELTTLYKVIYMRNEGNVSHTIYWNSTLSSETAEITDEWIRGSTPLNGTTIAAGYILMTNYKIQIQPYATVGTYNWTLTVWAEIEY